MLYGTSPKLSVYRVLLKQGQVTPSKIGRFEANLKGWFQGAAKGNCQVSTFEDDGDVIFLVSRGSYLRTVARWEKDEDITFTTYRPASEDIIAYDAAHGNLIIKAGLEKDRDHYLDAFAAHIAEDEGLAERARKSHFFSLRALQDDTFDFGGAGEVRSVDLLRVRFKLEGMEKPEIDIKSGDVRRTLSRLNLSLRGGMITLAKLRFHLEPQGERPAVVSFVIEPPWRTDLAQRRYTSIIEEYLSAQKVKLA